MFIKSLRGLGSGRDYPADQLMSVDPSDGRPVEFVIDIERIVAQRPDLAWYTPSRCSMWRFGALLGLDYDDPGDRSYIVSLGEGATPQIRMASHALAKRAGFALSIKDEGIGHAGFGKNPTASFKDRGMSMTLSMAKRFGLNRLVIPTQGNAGDALAEYAQAAGIEAAIVMPDNTPAPIRERVANLAKHSPAIRLELVAGTIREAGQYIAENFGDDWFSVATFREPGWRIEGKKTMGLELAEPAAPGGAWTLPDVVVYPTGGGTGLLGMWKAFAELELLGLIGPERPRMVSVQSDQTAPLVAAFESGASDTTPVEAGHTIATGLNVPGGIGHFRVLEILRESNGAAVAISEDAIRDALTKDYSGHGISLCPEGAACLAALDSLVHRDVIRAGDQVVVFNTCSAEKYA